MDKKADPKSVKSECSLELSSGVNCTGQLTNFSPDGLTMNTNLFLRPGQRAPKAGDTGVVTLHINEGGKAQTMKVPCRVAYLNANQIAVGIIGSMLTTRQKELIDQLIR